ncbi:uncharacterized protein MONBRDRAFT_23992 [Monosiga brevicollis MX1]|uniref:Uncharacterized protein n=1 Tax=Monosiga brevicollis TaxID=81824 RepID=A9UUD6_MONBE|nr:uncharacterized protein MONBRDRAFT_23992 [Monosiga brevicollis MX1]EDQ91078.1 predicted protein [Monosiga brevicollis MX1]|eukprot:XP_001744375.1 hypothetical protein [Monosiga brevicollis MX1]
MARPSTVTYVDLAELKTGKYERDYKGQPPAPKTVVYSDLQNVFDRATCERCGNLVDEHVRMLDQPSLASAVAVIKYESVPEAEPTRFDSALFSLALQYNKTNNTYSFPERRAEPGQRLDICARQAVAENLNSEIALEQVFCVSCHGTQHREPAKDWHTLSVLYAAPITSDADIKTVSLKQVLVNHDVFRMPGDQRDMLHALCEWLRHQCLAGNLVRVFQPRLPASREEHELIGCECYRPRMIRRVTTNAAFVQKLPTRDPIHRSFRSWRNPYWASGDLVSVQDDMITRRSFALTLEADDQDAAFESTTDPSVLPGRRSARPAPGNGPKRRASRARTSQAPRTSTQDPPVEASRAPAKNGYAKTSQAHADEPRGEPRRSAIPAVAPGHVRRNLVPRGAGDGVREVGDSDSSDAETEGRHSQHRASLSRRPTGKGSAAQSELVSTHSSSAQASSDGDSDQSDSADGSDSTAPRRQHGRPKRQPSLPEGDFNPLADDFQADFSNPLAQTSP